MIDIKADIDIREATRHLDNVQREQIPFATSVALNNAAAKSLPDMSREVRDSFDRPTPWIQKSARYTKATKAKPSITFGYDVFGNKQGVTAGKVLSAEVHGGERRLKRFEVALQRRGFLPSGMFAVPGEAAADLGMIDSYGNMKGSAIVQIMSKLGAFQEMGFTANATNGKRKRKAGRDNVYWVGKPGRNTPLGVWLIDEKSSGRGRLRPVLVFVKSARYEKRYDFHNAAAMYLRKHFDTEFASALQLALATAR